MEQNMKMMKIAVCVDSIDVLFITYIMHIVN